MKQKIAPPFEMWLKNNGGMFVWHHYVSAGAHEYIRGLKHKYVNGTHHYDIT